MCVPAAACAAGGEEQEQRAAGSAHSSSGATHQDGCCTVARRGSDGAAALPCGTGELRQRNSNTAASLVHSDNDSRLHQQSPSSSTDMPATTTDATSTKEQQQLLASLERDPHQPLALRVGLLGPDLYWQWAHRPLPGQARFFAHPLLEACTKTAWWVVPLLWLPLFLGCLAHAHRALHVPLAALPAWVALGVLCWQLLEYAIHRFVFHARPASYWGITLHFLLHGNHHKFPQDPLRLVFPPLPASLLVLAVWGALGALLPPRHAVPLFAGMGVGYVAYDCMHYAMHHAMGGMSGGGMSARRGSDDKEEGGVVVETGDGSQAASAIRNNRTPRGRSRLEPPVAQRVLRWMLRGVWRQHMAHHYRDPIKRGCGNYGISGSLFDRVLGTSL